MMRVRVIFSLATPGGVSEKVTNPGNLQAARQLTLRPSPSQVHGTGAIEVPQAPVNM
jgi:hypothetical protein